MTTYQSELIYHFSISWSTKFDSESGWPSFWAAIECEQTSEQKELGLPHLSVDQVLDESHGMVRIEVLCSQVTFELCCLILS